jgi:hypothetical protein
MMKLSARRVLAAIQNHSASGAAVRLGELSILMGTRVFSAGWQRARIAGLTAIALMRSRLIPAVRAHVQRLKTPRTSCLDLHPSETTPPELLWRRHLRDLVIELGSAPDPGEWIFCANPQGQWVWEYVVDRAVVARSTSLFSEFRQCLQDAKAHGFSSLFAFYSTRYDVPDTVKPSAITAAVS